MSAQIAVWRKSFQLSYDNAEALKWLAFACMVVDHVNTVFYGRTLSWAIPVGRFAMPIFAFLIGRHLVRAGRRHDALLKRLLYVGLAATVVYVPVMNRSFVFPLNILFTFALGALVVRWIQRGNFWSAGVAFVFGSVLVDYHWAGVFAVVTAWFWWEFRDDLRPHWRQAARVGLGLAMAGLCAFNGNLWAVLAVSVVVAAVRLNARVPRLRWFFWIGYPLHLLVLGLFLMNS